MSTPRTCPSCGAPASESERFCANCGARLPEAQAAAAPTARLDATGDQQAGPPTPPAGLPPAPPPARRSLPLWALILLGLAGLCALGCAGVATFVMIAGQEVSEQAATAVVELEETLATLPTEGAQPAETSDPADRPPTPEVILALPTDGPTPVGGASGAAGALGGGASGAAGQVQTAQAATAVVAGTAEAEALFAEASVVFQDEFVDNRNAWFVGVFNDIETDLIEDGVFKVIWAGEGTSYELYEVRELTSFIAEVDCLVRQGGGDGSCSLVFGAQEDGGLYKFELFDDYYRLYVVQAEGDPVLLLEGSPEGIVRPGEPNRLRVVRRGDDIAGYVNGVPVGEAADLTYLTGKVGVSTNSYAEGGVEIWFDNFVIWELP